MILTLIARAQDAAQPKPILHDTLASEVLSQLDYSYSPNPFEKALASVVAIRARLLDAWTAEFLNAQPEATALHLACGLDSRAQRLAWGPRMRWYDVDMPNVMALRQKLLANPEGGDYHLVASSVPETAWLDEVPADRPTVVIMEGLLFYLDAAEISQLLQRICERFPRGQILFNTWGGCVIRFQRCFKAFRVTGARVNFAMDTVRDLEGVLSNKLRVKDSLSVWQIPGLEMVPWHVGLLLWLCSWLPGLRNFMTVLRCEY